jgi:hypothetical protein
MQRRSRSGITFAVTHPSFSQHIPLLFIIFLLFVLYYPVLVGFRIRAINLDCSLGPGAASLLFIAVMTGSHRRLISDIQWSTGLCTVAANPRVIDVEYYGYDRQPDPISRPYIDIEPLVDPRDHSRHSLCSKLLVAMDRFLATRAGWMLRICDDTSVDPASFALFFSELLHFGDPLTSAIIQGEMIRKPYLDHAYPQGGSGIVFSRFAARELRDNFTQFVVNCQTSCNDDRATGLWMMNRRMPTGAMASRWFVGHSFRQCWAAVDIPKSLARVRSCPPQPPQDSGLRRFFHRVRDIAFWHARESFEVFGVNASRLRKTLPENLFFFGSGANPTLCFGETKQLRYFDD